MSSPHYGTIVQEVLSQLPKEDLSLVMCAFARSESAQDWKTFRDSIGSVTFHRWEPAFRAYSFSPYHILMEKNADRISDGPGLSARKKLHLTAKQTYHPQHAGMLFIAYWIEKLRKKGDSSQEIARKIVRTLSIHSLEKAYSVGKIYNGSASYGEKLWANLQYVRRSLK